LFTCFHGVSALIVDYVLWYSSSFSLFHGVLCLPCAKLSCLFFISNMSSSQDFSDLNLEVSLQGLV
jgi:hypothetical protein